MVSSPSVLTNESSGAVPAPLRIAVIGYGYWGPNLARNFAANPNSTLSTICDASPARLAAAHAAYPWARLAPSTSEVFADPDIDAVVVATPPETHRQLAIAALESGKHVLVEKPLATSVVDARDMLATAKRCGRSLLVDHTFLFTGAVRRMKEYIDAGEMGDIYYFDSTRINLGLFQSHTNVIWDLAPHDIAILLHLIKAPVRRVAAVGASHVNTTVENIAYLTLQFDGPMLAHCHVNWLAPVKIRKTIIGGSRKMLVFDDMEPSEKLKLYDSGAYLTASDEDVYRSLVEYRTGDVLVPRLDKTEALAAECTNALNVFQGTGAAISDGALGLRVVSVLEAAEQSLRAGGIPLDVTM
jgi:predicted dehydrogenase